jgi:hypothetical protein
MNMQFVFIKKGLIYNGCHCQLPTIDETEKFLNIYVGDRNEKNKSFIRQIKLDKNNLNKILDISENIFEISLQEFDSDGQMPSEIVKHNNNKFLFYTGWHINGSKYHHSICMAKMENNKWIKHNKPIIEPNEKNNFLNSSPKIIKNNNYFMMYFISGEDAGDWTCYGPQYKIWIAFSNDCINWTKEKINFPRKELEIFSRPFVFQREGLFHMLYTWMILGKIKNYKIGYANSEDGLNWIRVNNNILEQPSYEWDNESVAFPYIWRNYVFYSGNKFGKSGFGYAEIL